MAVALAKALGFDTASYPGSSLGNPDGYVGFSTSATFNYDLNRVPVTGQYDFIGTVAHETSEVMGRFSGLADGGTPSDTTYSPLDLYRYAGSGIGQQAAFGNPSYFSLDGGATNLYGWNNFTTGNFGDLGDWAAGSNDSFNDNSDAGVTNFVTSRDTTLIDVLGWDRAGPTNATVGAGVTAGGAVIYSGDQIFVQSGGTASATNILGGGSLTVASGGHTKSTTISSGGFETLSSGGEDQSTTINNGGSETVLPGGFANFTTVNSGGTEILLGGAANNTTVNGGGSLTVSAGGAASATTVSSGGLEFVGSGGNTGDTVIAGGAVELANGASAGGPITFAAGIRGGALEIDGSVMPSNTISGFAPGDDIHFRAVGGGSAGTVSLTANNVLKVVEDGQTYTLQLDPSQNFANRTFHLSSDSVAGTIITVGTSPSVTEALVSDTGNSSSDRITSNPAVTGTADPNAAVTIKEGSTTLGTPTANASGVWSFTPTLADGAHTLVASETDLAGNTGTASLSFTLKTSAPAPAAPALAPASDSGVKGDNITTVTAPTITGTGEAGDTVTLFDALASVGIGTVLSDGTWSVTATALLPGLHPLTATETDLSGNTSALSPALALTISDTAVFSGNLADYAVAYDVATTTFTVTDQRSGAPDGSQTFTNIMRFQFANGLSVYNAAGTLTSQTINDIAHAAPWAVQLSLFDAAGRLASQTVTNDNGTRWANLFDTANTQSWVWQTTNFDANGNALSQTTTNHDGTHSLAIHDAANTYTFADVTIGFDANWNMTSLTGTRDDGSHSVNMRDIASAYDTLQWFPSAYDPNWNTAFQHDPAASGGIIL